MKKSAQVRKGFTLVELLVVIAIIAILAAVVVLIVNPLELTKRGRDAARLSDLANIQQAVNLTVQESTASGSIACNDPDDADATCSETSNVGSRAVNGGGWVKTDLSKQTNVQVPTLPVDPINNGDYHYKYCGSGSKWAILAKLESDQQKAKNGTDGGQDPNAYEVGSDLAIQGCTY